MAAIHIFIKRLLLLKFMVLIEIISHCIECYMIFQSHKDDSVRDTRHVHFGDEKRNILSCAALVCARFSAFSDSLVNARDSSRQLFAL